MKVNDPNLTNLPPAATNVSASRASQSQSIGQSEASGTGSAGSAAGDDVHLSELVRSLRSLAAESPERQARLEQLARSYASGSYQVDAQATASKIVDDAFKP